MRGFELTIQKLDPESSRVWATRLGVRLAAGPVRLEDLQALGSRTWAELKQATDGLPCLAGDGWQPMGG